MKSTKSANPQRHSHYNFNIHIGEHGPASNDWEAWRHKTIAMQAGLMKQCLGGTAGGE